MHEVLLQHVQLYQLHLWCSRNPQQFGAICISWLFMCCVALGPALSISCKFAIKCDLLMAYSIVRVRMGAVFCTFRHALHMAQVPERLLICHEVLQQAGSRLHQCQWFEFSKIQLSNPGCARLHPRRQIGNKHTSNTRALSERLLRESRGLCLWRRFGALTKCSSGVRSVVTLSAIVSPTSSMCGDIQYCWRDPSAAVVRTAPEPTWVKATWPHRIFRFGAAPGLMRCFERQRRANAHNTPVLRRTSSAWSPVRRMGVQL